MVTEHQQAPSSIVCSLLSAYGLRCCQHHSCQGGSPFGGIFSSAPERCVDIYIYTYSNDFPSSGQKREDLDTVNQKLETINVTKKKLSIETLSIGLE